MANKGLCAGESLDAGHNIAEFNITDSYKKCDHFVFDDVMADHLSPSYYFSSPFPNKNNSQSV